MPRLRLLAARDVALAALVLLAIPSAAGAATADAREDHCALAPCVTEVRVAAGPGERNDLRLRREPDGAIVVEDAGAPLAAGAGCERRGDGSVRCALSRPIEQVMVDAGDGDDGVVAELGAVDPAYVSLGPGDDRFEGAAARLTVHAGDGDDMVQATGGRHVILQGSGGDDVVQGGPGNDEVSGGAGRDRVHGGAGNDRLDAMDVDLGAFAAEETPTGDLIIGGEGRDRVSYRNRRGPGTPGVVVDLSREGSAAGAPGERDNLASIEDVVGSGGPDRITGDGGPNRLSGHEGADVLDGGGGDDDVAAGYAGTQFDERRGADRARGGDGDDTVSSLGGLAYLAGDAGDDVFRPGRHGIVSCGDGADLVADTLFTPQISRACERWAIRVATTPSGPVRAVFPHPRRIADRVRLNVPCARLGAIEERCVAVLRVRLVGGGTAGEAREELLVGQRGTLVARLRGRARRGTVRAEVTLTIKDGEPQFWDRGGVVVRLS